MAHDLRHRVLVEVDVLVRQAWREWLLARAPQTRVVVTQRQPARLAERACRLLFVVDHEGVEPLEVVHLVADGPVGHQLATVRAAARAALLDVREIVEREQPQPGAIGTQPRLVDPALGDEPAEHRQRAQACEHGRPAQAPGVQRDLQLPLERLAQPWLFDDGEVIAGARDGRLVVAQRDAGVEPWAPRVVLPPLARVIGDQQVPVAAPEDPRPPMRPGQACRSAALAL